MTNGTSLFGATVRGSAHAAAGEPAEDAWRVHATKESDVVAVADGHGSHRCPRAALGAQLAVDVAVQILAELTTAAQTAQQLAETLAERLPALLVGAWQDAVLAHHAGAPFNAEELAAIGEPDPDRSATLLAYGSTLIAAARTAHGVAMCQIGDGDAVVALADGAVLRPIRNDPSNVGHLTSSLAQFDAVQAVRTVLVDYARHPVDLVFLSTDGFGAAQADPDWWELTARQLRDRIGRLDPAQVAASLPEWIADAAVTGGDDVTLVVLVDPAPRTPGTPRIPPPGPAVRPTANLDPSGARPS